MSNQLRARMAQTEEPSAQSFAQTQAGHSNALLVAQLQQAGEIPRPRPRPERLTPRAAFEQRYLAQRSQEVDPSEERWKRLSEEEIAALASVPEEERPGPGEAGYHTAIGEDTWQWDAHAQDPETPLRRGDLMGGDADQVFSRAFSTANPDYEDRTDVTVLNADGTSSVLSANEHGMVELPESGFGFTTHNRDDVRVNGQPQPDQWGSAASVTRTMNTMSDYRTMFPGSTLSIGDLSTDTGNSPRLYSNRATRHATHYDGTQVDLQYPHGTGSTNWASTEDGDLFRHRSLVRTAEDWGFDNFHASRRLRNDLFETPEADMHHSRPHDNHLHMGQGNGRR